MRVTCLQENLAKGLATVSRAVATRSSLPVLTHVLLRTQDGQLRLSATNLEIGITCLIGAKVAEVGAITVPARLLSGLVDALPAGPIEMELDVRTKTLRLQCGQHEAGIKGIDATEFPLMPALDPDQLTIRFAARPLAEMIEQVVFAAAIDETRPVLTGVLARLEPDKLTLVASDGFRLSVRQTPLRETLPIEQEAVVPAQALQELARLAKGRAYVDMQVSPARNQVFFRMDKVDLVCQLVEGRFPDYQHFVPARCNTSATASTMQMLEATKLARYFAHSAANIVRIEMDPHENRLLVAAQSSDTGHNSSIVPAIIQGEAMVMHFNAQYLIDALTVIDTPQVVLETSTVSSPGLIRPLGRRDFLHIIVPIIVHDSNHA